MKTQLLITTILTTGFAAAAVEAADEVEGAELPINEIEIGIGSVNQHGYSTVDEDLWKFGRYNGLNFQGPYIIGDIHTQDIDEDGSYWNVRGTNLGLESRYFRLDSGTQGKTDFFFEFDQQPNYINNTGETPYLYPGSTQLLLPPGYPLNPTASDINPYLQPVEFQTERQRVGAGLDIKLKNYWSFDVGFRHENKDGTNQIGSAIVSTASSSGWVRSASGALIIEPIDYETDLVDAAIRYAKDKAQFAFEYHGSTFKNANDSLYWQDFYRAQFGSLALPPDNQMHQLSFSGGYQFSPKYNLTGALSISRSTQNQDFQPYNVGTITLPPLPRDSLDGEVLQVNTNIKFTYRPSRNFRFNVNYRYDNRDNKTDVARWYVTVADSDEYYQDDNNPLSYEHNQLDFIGNWRIGSMSSLRFGYEYDLMYREYATITGSEDSDNQENKLFAKYKLQPSMAWNLALYGEASDRTLNNYDPPPDEGTSGMIPYYLAERQRTQLGAMVEYLPNHVWQFGARAEYNMDDYDEAQIGLLEAEMPSFTLDAAYHPNKNVSTYAYYTRELMKSKQKGRDTTTASPDNYPWQADFDDTMDTFGLGGKVAGLGKWDIGLDFTYNKSKGQIDITDLSSSTTSPYPDLKTELTSLQLWAEYHQGKNLVYRLSYWYEDYDADDWALDNLQPTSLVGLPAAAPPGAITNYLLTGEDTLDYAANVIGISLVYKFQ